MEIRRENDKVILKEKDLNLLGETMVTMGADLFQTLYDMSDEMDYTMTACLIRDAAMEFEQELNWNKENDDRDYLIELEKFEQKKLEEWRGIYA